MFLDMNYNTSASLKQAILDSMERESTPLAKNVLLQIHQNQEIAEREQIPICQDTGMAIVFVSLGQEVCLTGKPLSEALTDGVKSAYEEGYLRKSVVRDPLFERKNTGDNTPPVIYYDIVPGDQIHLLGMAKGFGSENMSRIKMLKPADGVEGVKEFVVETVKTAGPNPCPPIIVGVGIGGTMEKAAMLSKLASAREIGTKNPHPQYAALEETLLQEINLLAIGPGGLSGVTTALAVNIEYFPTHIAGLPVAVNICCHASRHREAVL